MKDIDPQYYTDENSGGYWLKSPDYEEKAHWMRRMIDESNHAVSLGIACYLDEEPGSIPF